MVANGKRGKRMAEMGEKGKLGALCVADSRQVTPSKRQAAATATVTANTPMTGSH